MTTKAALTTAAATTAGTAAAATAVRAHSPEVSAARARRWGAFYYAEQVLRVMKGYGWTIVMYGVGQPVAYLFAMGVGLATLVEANGAGVFGGVSYLTFVAPALLISAAVMTAANEFTFPVMDGFKWRRVYYGPNASPLTPEQIAGGQIIAVTVRFLLQSAIYFAVMALFGAAPGAWGWVSILIATLAGLSFGLPLMAYAATIQDDKGQFAMVMRFIVMPLFLFSGTFFPLDTLPLGSPLDRLDLADLARNGTWPRGQLRLRGRAVAHHRPRPLPAGPGGCRLGPDQTPVRQKDGLMSVLTGSFNAGDHSVTDAARRRRFGPIYSRNVRAVVARGLMATKSSNWMVMVSGFFEPVLYLISMGVGLGAIVGSVQGPGGQEISYAAYIAPALLAVSAMNGAIYDSTWNVFFKMNFAKLYQGMLYTSLGPLDVAMGEIFLALLRGAMYAIGFTAVMGVMGLITTPWAILMIPASVLIAFGFASFGMGITSYMKTFQQMDWINFVMLPMFLFSATFYPLSVYPQSIQWFIQAMPLWHGVELLRQISVGVFTPATAVHIGYYLVMIALGVLLTTSRLRKLFLK